MADSPVRRNILRLLSALPTLLFLASTAAVVVCVRRLLDEAASGSAELPGLPWMIVAAVATFFSGAGIVLVQAYRSRQRLTGPSRRMQRALRKIRLGDLSFRIRLRRGDPLRRVADEVNLMLDWLNAHPPEGEDVLLGGDLVDVEDIDSDVVDVAVSNVDTERVEEHA